MRIKIQYPKGAKTLRKARLELHILKLNLLLIERATRISRSGRYMYVGMVDLFN